tara:strand:- start:1726 stop:2313 length:588 start_codon:yes stop_codon:yes gene_type:complete
MKSKLVKTFYRLAYLWWSYWSKAYRLLYHFKYRKVELPSDLKLTEVEENLNKLRWSPDTWKELWDVCGSPKRVQHELNAMTAGKKWPYKQMDCDDFAIWAANTIDRNFYPRVYTFSWLSKDDQVQGHAMCLCRSDDGKIFHMGNWGTSKPYNNLREACEDILKTRKAKEALCWGLFDKNLKLLECGSGLPSEKIS